MQQRAVAALALSLHYATALPRCRSDGSKARDEYSVNCRIQNQNKCPRADAGRKGVMFVSKPRIIDLHNHIIPLTLIDAARREPGRYGMRVEDRDGKIFYERRGKLS